MTAALTFRNVDIVFGNKPRAALDLLDAGKTRDEIIAATGQVVGVADASLTVESGEICVLMGLSGSGKSTLLRSVNRLNETARGDVIVTHEGRDINVATCDAKTLRDLRSRGVAMVFQQFALLPWRTVRDNVGLGLELRGASKAERDRIVTEKLEMVGLGQWAGKYAHELSGGMQQRVGLARAFATDADILLMDEPFSALDPLIRAKLQDELLDLQAKLKKTILFVSHDLDEAIKLGNRIVIMEGGRIVQAGTAQDIVLRPADGYVAEFVRHMNPLEGLRAASVMTPLADIPRDGAVLEPCSVSKLRLTLHADGTVASVTHGATALPGTIVAAASVNGARQGAAAVTVRGDAPLKQAVALRHAENCPILVLDDADALLGTICEPEIFRALLRV
ncbi:choline ABC transporter ATP-binding protein [Lichenihabitans psoromatis]|uniref:choline ABC transporter ATP-binding protein n=1 Tax=Lichenihabitans psoromatis TaxID=2528642 RepID=UPI0010363E86|nr:choline ABC transporter ATP-binding protein [Lichenihabitans psoromatis]